MKITTKDIIVAINDYYLRKGFQNLDPGLSSIMAADIPFIITRREWNVILDIGFGMNDRQARDRWYGFQRSGYLSPLKGTKGDEAALFEVQYIADQLDLTEATIMERK